MTQQHLNKLLERLAERSASSEIDLWPAVRAKFQSAKGISVMNKTIRQTRVHWLAGVAVTLCLGVVMVAATPQGRAWAQTIWQFFTQAQSTSFPVDNNDVVPPDPHADPIPTAAPPAGLSNCEGLIGEQSFVCQAKQAEVSLGFDLKLPSRAISGLEFVYAQVNADQEMAMFVYTAVGGGSELSISQGKEALDSMVWELVPPEATVEQVEVGGFDGEYVRGMFVVYANASEATWSIDAPVQRLRWREGDTLYEIRLDGEVEAVEYLDRDGLIALAETLQ